MAVLLIRLSPFMKKSAQEFSLNNICRLCTLNMKNQIQACNNNMLLHFIELLTFHNRFSPKLIENIFRTIQTLGKCAIHQNELFEFMQFLHPKNQFPYGMHVLRCLTLWAKTSTSIGMNLSILDGQSGTSGGGGGASSGGGSKQAGGVGSGGSGVNGGGGGFNENDASPMIPSSTAAFLLNNPSLVSPAEYNLTDNAKLRRTSLITINQNVLNNMMRTIGTGALSQNAHQQAKYFFDFQQQNSVITRKF